jgi:hypothetical protein
VREGDARRGAREQAGEDAGTGGRGRGGRGRVRELGARAGSRGLERARRALMKSHPSRERLSTVSTDTCSRRLHEQCTAGARGMVSACDACGEGAGGHAPRAAQGTACDSRGDARQLLYNISMSPTRADRVRHTVGRAYAAGGPTHLLDRLVWRHVRGAADPSRAEVPQRVCVVRDNLGGRAWDAG